MSGRSGMKVLPLVSADHWSPHIAPGLVTIQVCVAYPAPRVDAMLLICSYSICEVSVIKPRWIAAFARFRI